MPIMGKYSVLLRPLACLYGLGVELRNFFFDRGLLRSVSYPIPVICVGNITVGGTGKTPHVEYILRCLLPRYRVAVLSRGYKRSSRGMIVATMQSTVAEIGDEPRQIKLKFPSVALIVDGNRRRAMDYLMALPEGERPEVVVMDDGLQHRYVKPSYTILLVDSQRPIQHDKLLPEGDLREPASARYRADCIIATKCPASLSAIQQRIVERNLAPYPHQRIFFSRICYGRARHLTELELAQGQSPTSVEIPAQARVYLISGIARPQPLIDHLSAQYVVVGQETFADHHNFSDSDLERINTTFASLSSSVSSAPLYAVCTEKDAVRLWELRAKLSPTLLEALLYIPIEMSIMHRGNEFERMIQLAARALRPKA